MSTKQIPDFRLLNQWAKKGISYLHPLGKRGTAKLIKTLNLSCGMQVLEFGCGTGATLANLSLIPGLNLKGVDISSSMIQTAKQRLRFCGIHRDVQIKLIKPGEKLPFPDASMDVVYAESVLAIVDETLLPSLLMEILRILKPGGRFATLDAIWKEECSAEQIALINQLCMIHFGMVQSLANPSDKKDWQCMFEKAGFRIVSSQYLSHETTTSCTHRINRLSSLFTKLKKISILLSPWYWYAQLKTLILIKKWHTHDRDYLQNYLFLLEKPDTR